MLIMIKVIAGARKNCIKKTVDLWTVYVSAPAVEGKANKAVIRLLSEEFQIAKNRIEIIKGLKSRYKTININDITTYGIFAGNRVRK